MSPNLNGTAYERVLGALQAHGCRTAESNGHGTSSTCPAHEDANPSLSLRRSDGRALIFCHAGCSTSNVMEAIGLGLADLYDERSANYPYDDGRTVKRDYGRDGKKRFRQTGAGPTSTLYHLGRLADIPADRYVFLVEGEADVHAIEAEGGVATTAPQGADSFHKVDVSPLAGRLVTCVVDKDAAGNKWAVQVRQALHGVARDYRFVQAAEGKDSSDHIAAGHGLIGWVPYVFDPEPEPEREPETRQVTLRAASGMKMARVRWLQGGDMGGHIPLGGITLLAGREGIGKSTITYDIIGKLTTGTLHGEFHGNPRGVIIYATEDEWEPVILPRLAAAGADHTRVFRAEVEQDGAKDWISFPRDLKRLGAQAREHDVALLILDPIMSIIDGKLDTHKDREVRQALDPLSRFATDYDLAVIGLIHANKSSGTDPVNSVMGSRAFSAAARSVLYCIRVPPADGEAGPEEFLYSHEKCNLGPKQGSQKYTIEQVILHAEADDGNTFRITTSKIRWGDVDERRAADVMEEAARPRAKGGLRQDIKAWLIEQGDVLTPVGDIVAEFGSRASRNTIDKTLSRMVSDDEIERPQNGLYRAKLVVRPAIPPIQPRLTGF
jgi:AAA domain